MRQEWTQICPPGWWATWQSCHDGRTISGSGVSFTGTLPDGRVIARTYDGREWTQVRVRA